MLKWCIPAALLLASTSAFAQDATSTSGGGVGCGIAASTVAAVQGTLAQVVKMDNGGIFSPNVMWSAVVDRQGRLCSVITTGGAWPGSRAIAIAKAYTANGFSNDQLAISTANLYAPTQPGGSLYGLNNSNPFNPFFLPQNLGVGFVAGGIITFGGGVALYSGGHVIGGLGVSGDTSCTDHTIAYRMRAAAGLNGIPKGLINNTDNIDYLAPNEPSDTGFKHPHCLPTDVTP